MYAKVRNAYANILNSYIFIYIYIFKRKILISVKEQICINIYTYFFFFQNIYISSLINSPFRLLESFVLIHCSDPCLITKMDEATA